MNNQNPDPNPTPSANVPPGAPTNPEAAGNPPPAGYQDWREQRRSERWARREARWQRRAGRHTGWFGGVFLILLGVIFLLRQMGIPFFANWWALFILIPAFWAYVAAWDSYQDGKRLTRRAAASLTVGILLTILALLFLLNVASGFVWPALLIVGGLALVGSALVPE
jgi:ABC-type multidrug transport system fused ATPase/permease subunit